MSSAEEKAYGKLNLTLDVTGKRPDGYHDLTMVMISVKLCDELSLTLRRDGEFTVSCNLPWVPRDGRNLAVKAAQAFREAVGDPLLGADITIRKRVPVGAGMAGGSTDAAAVLRALNRLTDSKMDSDALRTVGLAVGSDVPYCIEGGARLARGRGELLCPLRELPDWPILICKPRFSISTAELFRLVDSRTEKTRPDTEGMLCALEEQSLPGVCRRMFNVFEDVLPRNCREVLEVRRALLSNGAEGAVMTGTGSAVFGIFSDAERAEAAREELSRRWRDCFLCSPQAAIEI